MTLISIECDNMSYYTPQTSVCNVILIISCMAMFLIPCQDAAIAAVC